MMARELTEIHTRILRTTLLVEASKAYWDHVDPQLSLEARAVAAFENRWFGSKSLPRVRELLTTFSLRFDAHPEAFAVLRRWRSVSPATRTLICHWHVQLSDPLYRRFTGHYLPARRAEGHHTVTRSAVSRWAAIEGRDRWGTATLAQFGSKLLRTAAEAGLVSGKKEPRQLILPQVPNDALSYLLLLLRGLDFEGALTNNPYLTSVGLTDDFLEERLRGLAGLHFQRLGSAISLDWETDLTAWAEGLVSGGAS